MLSAATKYGILVGVDSSAPSDAAVRFGARESVMRDAPLTLMHVIEPIPAWATLSEQARIAAAWEENAGHVVEQARKTALASVPPSAQLNVRTEVACSPVVPLLLVASSAAQMLIVGGRGMTTLGRLLLGSVSSGVIHHAHCPVVVARDMDVVVDDNAPVLVGVDGSPASETAVALAFEEASRRGVELVALHAWSDVGVFPILGMNWRDYETQGAELLAQRLAGYQQDYPDVHVRRRLVCDKPARWLIEESSRAQLVIVGRRGRGGFRELLMGSVSSALAQSSTSPVIICP